MKNKEDMKLFEVLNELKSAEEFKIFFEDLCTIQEVEKMEQRVLSAQLLLDGETYQHIMSKTEISSATLSRISRCIQYGSGGYAKLLSAIIAKQNGESAQNEPSKEA